MTTVTEVQDLAAELQQHRPDWPDILPIVNYLLPWRHLPYDDLRAMTLAWVKDHGNRTPASLKYMPGVPPKQAGGSSSTRTSKEPRCYICGSTRADCVKARDFEIANGIPDPHEFETKEQALANRSDRQWPELAEELNRLRGERAKERADRARAQIRPMIATNGDRAPFSRLEDQPRRCSGCGGTLSQDEHETHPGCAPDHQPAPPPSERRVQEPKPEETPAT